MKYQVKTMEFYQGELDLNTYEFENETHKILFLQLCEDDKILTFDTSTNNRRAI